MSHLQKRSHPVGIGDDVDDAGVGECVVRRDKPSGIRAACRRGQHGIEGAETIVALVQPQALAQITLADDQQGASRSK